MHKKPKIAIVASDLVQPRFLALFEALRDVFDVCIYALNNEALINLHGTGLKLRLFENIADMPGYLRGLEEELAQCDAIIGLETSRLGTFQAVRVARKFNKPLAVVVNEHIPFFYERYANIRAIQFDICNKADLFFATSALAAKALQQDRVPVEAIKLVKPVINLQKFQPNPNLRAKFRDYIGIGANEIVILFHNELEAWNRPELVLQAFSLMHRQAALTYQSVRLLFAGTGAMAPDLKYRCFDLGLGKSTMFLHQNPEPFLVDLYAACDILVAPASLRADFHEELPLFVLEAMAVGVVPVVSTASLAHEFIGEAGVAVAAPAADAWADALQRLVGNSQSLNDLSKSACQWVQRQYCQTSNGALLVNEMWTLIESHQDQCQRRVNLPAELQIIAQQIEQGHLQVALHRIEELLLLDLPPTTEKSDLYCARAEVLQMSGDMEGAMNSFSDALKINDRNYRCFRGLGVLSWQSHSNEEALMFYRKALALRPGDVETMLGIGLVYRRLGLANEALFWLEKCLASDGYPPSALVALTQTCMESPQAEQSIKILERLMDVLGEVAPILMTLGQLYMNCGRVEQGHAMLQKALAAGKPAA